MSGPSGPRIGFLLGARSRAKRERLRFLLQRAALEEALLSGGEPKRGERGRERRLAGLEAINARNEDRAAPAALDHFRESAREHAQRGRAHRIVFREIGRQSAFTARDHCEKLAAPEHHLGARGSLRMGTFTFGPGKPRAVRVGRIGGGQDDGDRTGSGPA